MICEYCGRTSKTSHTCSVCGTAPANICEHIHPAQSLGEWGWAEISIAQVSESARPLAIDVIQTYWSGLENFTVLRLLVSQTPALVFDDTRATVLVKRDLFDAFSSHLKQHIQSIELTFISLDKTLTTAQEAIDLLRAHKQV